MYPLSMASRNGDSGGIRFERLLHCETSGGRLERHPTDPLTRTTSVRSSKLALSIAFAAASVDSRNRTYWLEDVAAMNLTVEIAGALAAIVFVYTLCRRDWPTAAAAMVGAILFAIIAIMRGSDERRDY
jgi:hypothetical protein